MTRYDPHKQATKNQVAAIAPWFFALQENMPGLSLMHLPLQPFPSACNRRHETPHPH